MSRFIAGLVVGATLVAGAVFAFVATTPPPRPTPAIVPMLELKLLDAEQERDRLRIRVEWLEAESAAWKGITEANR